MHTDAATGAASSISNRKPCNPSTTPSAQGCHPCLRYVPLPMSPVRTADSPVEGDGFEPSVPLKGTKMVIEGREADHDDRYRTGERSGLLSNFTALEPTEQRIGLTARIFEYRAPLDEI